MKEKSIDYNTDFKGWKVYDPVTKRTLISRDVIFDEHTMPGSNSAPSNAPYLPSHLKSVPESRESIPTQNYFTPLSDHDDSDPFSPDTDCPNPPNPPSPPSSPTPTPTPSPSQSPSPA